MSERQTEPHSFFETQFLLAYGKLVTSSVQRPGHVNLIEKTKVMACICKQTANLLNREEGVAGTDPTGACLIAAGSMPFSHTETQISRMSPISQTAPHPPFLLTQIEMTGSFPNRFKHL